MSLREGPNVSENLHLLAGAYALDALSTDERAFYERHLAACEPCRHEVEDYRRTAATLAKVAAEPPPPELRAVVLAAADRTRQLSPLPDTTEVFARRLRPVLAPVAASLVAVVLGLAGISAFLWQENRELQQLASILQSDGQTATLEGTLGSARLLYSQDRDEGVFVASDLEAPGEGSDYQLWVFHEGSPVPAGVFRPGGDELAQVRLEAPVRGAESVAVTVEPAGGVETPTGDIVLSADL